MNSIATSVVSSAGAAPTSRDVARHSGEFSHADVENIVRRSYQYVALCDTPLNFMFNKKSPFAGGGWNKTQCPEGNDGRLGPRHSAPNNDTLCAVAIE
jgi:hypothetical protein